MQFSGVSGDSVARVFKIICACFLSVLIISSLIISDHNSLPKPNKSVITNHTYDYNQTFEKLELLNYFKTQLSTLENPEYDITGFYSGTFSNSNYLLSSNPLINVTHEIPLQDLIQKLHIINIQGNGSMSFTLWSEPSELSDLHITGSLLKFYNERTNVEVQMKGYYFPKLNKLTMFSQFDKLYTTIHWAHNDTNYTLHNMVKLHEVVSNINACPLQLDMQFQSDNPNTKYVTGFGSINSTICKIQVSFQSKAHTFNLQSLYEYAYKYGITVIAMVGYAIYITNSQINRVDTYSRYMKISYYSIALGAMYDTYLCLFHFLLGIVNDKLSNLFQLNAILLFLLFATFELRFMLIIWKFSQHTESLQQLSSGITYLYLKYYTIIFIGLIFGRYITVSTLYFIILMSFWVPQIIHNAYYNYRKTSLSDGYLYGISAYRLFFPLYFLLFPHNIYNFVFGGKPQYLYSFLVAAYVGIQVLIVKLQQKNGPRFFIPWNISSSTYDYYRPIPQSLYDLESNSFELPDCSICLEKITDNNYMITPCNHFFHRNCLNDWMEIKMECPVDRQPIPEVE